MRPRRAVLSLLLLLTLLSRPGAAEDAEVFPRSRLRGFDSAARALAKGGKADEVTELIDRLVDLGLPEDVATKLREECDRMAGRAASRPDPRAASRAASTIRREVRKLAGRLGDLSPEARKKAARALLELDAACDPAHRLLGHVEAEGRWVTPQESRDRVRRSAFQEALRKARAIPVEVKHAGEADPIVQAGTGQKGARVQAKGIEIHGILPAPRLARVLRETLRATAVGGYLMSGRCEIPKLPKSRFFVVRTKAEYVACLEELQRRGVISASQVQEDKDEGSVYIRSDEPLLLVMRYLTEAPIEADLTYTLLYETLWKPKLPGYLGHAQACLWGGICNLACLAYLGTAMPSIAWYEAEEVGQKSTTKMDEERLLRLFTSAGLVGHRRRLAYLVEEDKDPPWARAMVDEVGKIEGDELIKATSVVEYLYERKTLVRLLGATFPKDGDERPIVRVFEDALGASLGEIEKGWRRWFLRDRPPDLVSRIEAKGDAGALTEEQKDGLEHLNQIRGRTDLDAVGYDRFLGEDAAKHARYLVRNPDQRAAWPDAHEEWPDRPGYSPEGQWSGAHSVISSDGTVKGAIDAWMGTFYHRLPLLDPGLLRVGWGCAKREVVLDSGSLVMDIWYDKVVAWPPSGLKGVPTSFRPELPNPVPGEDQSGWGYPVTLQVWGKEGAAPGAVTMTLHVDREDGPVVDCHYSTPSKPTNPLLAPGHAFCLIPKRQLRPGMRYWVVAVLEDAPGRTAWSFITRR